MHTVLVMFEAPPRLLDSALLGFGRSTTVGIETVDGCVEYSAVELVTAAGGGGPATAISWLLRWVQVAGSNTLRQFIALCSVTPRRCKTDVRTCLDIFEDSRPAYSAYRISCARSSRWSPSSETNCLDETLWCSYVRYYLALEATQQLLECTRPY